MKKLKFDNFNELLTLQYDANTMGDGEFSKIFEKTVKINDNR
jgi:hypothetical protein